jgi:hypothetical protein
MYSHPKFRYLFRRDRYIQKRARFGLLPLLVFVGVIWMAAYLYAEPTGLDTTNTPPPGKGAFGIWFGKRYEQTGRLQQDLHSVTYEGPIPKTNSNFEQYIVSLTPVTHRAFSIVAIHHGLGNSSGESTFRRVGRDLAEIYGPGKISQILDETMAEWKTNQVKIWLGIDKRNTVTVSYENIQIEKEAIIEMEQIQRAKSDKTGL